MIVATNVVNLSYADKWYYSRTYVVTSLGVLAPLGCIIKVLGHEPLEEFMPYWPR